MNYRLRSLWLPSASLSGFAAGAAQRTVTDALQAPQSMAPQPQFGSSAAVASQAGICVCDVCSVCGVGV